MTDANADPPATDPLHDAAAVQEAQPEADAVANGVDTAVTADPALEKYNELYAIAKGKPEDFTAWTSLLSAADKLDASHIAATRAAYDGFLSEFPLCYGYWKKYAEAEKRAENMDTALEVYERAVQSVPYSPEMWVAYAAFLQARGHEAADIRKVYERGLAYVGTDYNSHNLWDKYITFEQEHGSSPSLVALYPRILACPLKELDRYYKATQLLARTKDLGELLLPEVAAELRAAVSATKQQEAAAAAAAAAAKQEPAAAADGADGDTDMLDAPPGADDGEAPATAAAEAAAGADGGNASAAAAVEASDEEVKEAWLKQCTAVYEATKEHVLGLRKPFEEKIKRPYFHVKPLDPSQLSNWVAYLDWVEGTGSVAATVHLYERCLVACASYPEFWMRYIRWLDAHNPDTAPAALQRGALLFCKRNPDMQLFAAQYEEQHGQAEVAWSTFMRLLEEVAPGWLQGIVAAANFQRRAGNKAGACYVYDSAIARLTAAVQEQAAAGGGQQDGGSSSSKVQELVFLSLQYAQFLWQLYQDSSAARQVVGGALDLAPSCKSLWEGAIWMEQQVPGEDRLQRVCGLYERALQQPASKVGEEQPAAADSKQEAAAGEQQGPDATSEAAGADGGASASAATAATASPQVLSQEDRESLSSQYIEYVDMYGDAELLARVQQRHAKEFMLPAHALKAPAGSAAAATDASRKRAAAAAGAAAAGSPAAKAARTDDAAAAAAAAAGGGAAAAADSAAAGYGYPPPPGGYGAYPGYGYGGWYGYGY